MTTIDTTASFITDEQDVRARLNLDAEDHKLDEVMVQLINASAKIMEEYTRRRLKQRAYSGVLLDGNGQTELYLPEYPVLVAGLAVNVDGTRNFNATTALTVWDESTNIAAAELILDPDSGLMERIDGGVFDEGLRTVQVSYTGGVASGDDEHLIEAQHRILQDWWHRIGEDPAIQQISVAGISHFLIRGTGPESAISTRLNPFSRAILDAERKAVWD